MINPLTIRVAARFQRQADQPPGQRKRVRDNTDIINKPRGIGREITQDYAKSKEVGENIVKPDPRDVQPKDLFNPVPSNIGVLNLVETGRDLSRALDKQVPKDRGYETVNNLSQYLIRTEGGGEGGPEGKRS